MPTRFNELEFVNWLQARMGPRVPLAKGLGDECADIDWRTRGPALTRQICLGFERKFARFRNHLFCLADMLSVAASNEVVHAKSVSAV